MSVDRNKESKQCTACKLNYDLTERKPYCYIPCGHTQCAECISKNKRPEEVNKQCPICSSQMNQVIPDHEMCDIIKRSPPPKPKPKGLNRAMKGKMLKFMMEDQG